MRCFNCGEAIGSQERVVLQVKGPTYCWRCTPQRVGTNGRALLQQARALLKSDGVQAVHMTIRRYRGGLVYEVRARR